MTIPAKRAFLTLSTNYLSFSWVQSATSTKRMYFHYKMCKMIPETANREEVIVAIDSVAKQLLAEIESLGADKINRVPFPDSWTPAQLADHLIKSADGITYALKKSFEKAPRDPKERLSELQSIFLDMSSKLESPDRLRPGQVPFNIQTLTYAFRESYDRVIGAAAEAALDTLVNGFPLGPVTKWELLHFTVYHSTRHLRQLKIMATELKK